MCAQRNALGRGLGALIPGASRPAAQPADRAGTPGADDASQVIERPALHQLPVSAIDANPEQPRRVFDAAQLESLADSIRRHGVLQPVIVRSVGARYELIVGERRWRAARAAGLETIPAVVADHEPADRLELAIVENVQRHDLNPIELAHAYRALADRGMTQEEIGQRVSLDRSSVANHLRLLELSRDLQEDVETGSISMGHAKALLQVSNPERRRHLRDRVVEESLSVRDTERIGREIAGPVSGRSGRRQRTALDANLQRLVELWQHRLQTRVRIQGTPARGRIEIEYFGSDDLDRLARLLLGETMPHEPELGEAGDS